MTWTRAFGNGSGWLLQKIVNGLALSRISPNTLTFIGLIINVVAAFFFGGKLRPHVLVCGPGHHRRRPL
jgi:CDP-diacylglycerol--glycerol-3-phosphate 3-phosphatidyltransferase